VPAIPNDGMNVLVPFDVGPVSERAARTALELFGGALVVLLVTLGAPVLATLSGSRAALFYVHVALGAFWFGLDFFFKFVLGPAMAQSPDDAAGAVNGNLVPRLAVVAEPLSVGVVGSGLALAHRLGHLADPSPWVWAAVGVSTLMLVNGFGPLHFTTTRLTAERNAGDPDPDRIEARTGRVQKFGLLQTAFMIAVLLTMVGMRGLLPL